MFKDAKIQAQLLYATIFILIVGISVFTFLSINTLIFHSEWVSHTHLIISNGHKLGEILLEMQTNKQGFIITGDELFFKTYLQKKEDFEKFVSSTQKLVKDNLEQVDLLEEIKSSTQQWHQVVSGAEVTMRRELDQHLAGKQMLQTAMIQPEDREALEKLESLLKELQYETQHIEDVTAEHYVLSLARTLALQEVNLRNFLLTNEHTFLEVYQAKCQTLTEQIIGFKAYLIDKIRKTNLLNSLHEFEVLVKSWQQQAVEPEIKLYKQVTSNDMTFQKIADLVKQGASENILFEVQEKLALFVEHEELLLVSRKQKEGEITFTTIGISLGGNVVIILLGVLIILFFSRQDWLKNGQAQLNEKMKGEQEMPTLTKNIISFISNYLEINVGLLYLFKDANLELVASYAYTPSKDLPAKFALGEGLIGEAALERRIIFRTHAPDEYKVVIQSGLSQTVPRRIVIVPLIYENDLMGVIELGSMCPLKKVKRQWLESVTASIGIALNTANSRTKMEGLLEQSQRQEKVLQNQQAELQQINEELQIQTEELKTQQEELSHSNEELKLRTHELEQQREAVREKNRGLEEFQERLLKLQSATEEKAQALEIASKYKSEFLANMSHELRTPLNSVLMLAQLLAENKGGNLTEKQIDHMNTIYHSGSDLLSLINDVLDLSKIEAGKMEIHYEKIPLTSLVESVKQKFNSLAETKELDFQIVVAENIPEMFETDVQRLRQIIANLLSNAFKFTAEGWIKFIIERPTVDEEKIHDFLPNQMLAIRVADTGIGIPEDKQKLIFEAFQQVDGTMSRRYGGTGLGLSISRQLTELLNGKLGLVSEENKGCTFTLYLPEVSASEQISATEVSPSAAMTKEVVNTGEEFVQNKQDVLKDKKVLIVDDDQRNVFAMTLVLDGRGMITLSCNDGKEALAFLDQHRDIDIVLMDIMMPEMDGYETIQRIREQAHFRKLPIIALTAKAMKGDKEKCIEAGASDYLTKPVSNERLISLIRVWLS